MQKETAGYSLDAHRVDEEEVRTPTLFPVSIMTCKTEFVQPVTNVVALKNSLNAKILEKYAFQKPERKEFKEGFLEFSSSSDNIINCFFAKEAPTKIMYEANDLKMHSQRYRLIIPSFSVKIKIAVEEKSANVVMFGGSETMMAKALTEINYCIRDVVTGGHTTVIPEFSKGEMNTILKNFGIDVEYIWIHPGESQRFMKIIERKVGGEIKKIPEYIVHAKLHGFHITGSPITTALVEESGVYLKEIQGRLNYAVKVGITSRVSSNGKVLFFIPENIVGKRNTVYDIAENLYGRIIVPVEGPKQATMGEYLPEKS